MPSTRVKPAAKSSQQRAYDFLMPVLVGHHRQGSTGRVFRYRVEYVVIDSDVYFFGSISEPGKGLFGSLERGTTFDGSLPHDMDWVPVELAVRSRALSHVERTDFGEWKPPPPSWRGWYGPI